MELSCAYFCDHTKITKNAKIFCRSKQVEHVREMYASLRHSNHSHPGDLYVTVRWHLYTIYRYLELHCNNAVPSGNQLP